MPATRLFDRRTFTDLALVCGVIAGLALLKDDWLFNSTTYFVDGWMYLGYFLHYDLPSMLAGNKKIARLPWILSGYLVHSGLSPVPAALVLHLGVFGTGAAALYLLVRRLLDRAVALVVATFYAAYVVVHGSAGWDYHNTLAGPLYVLTYIVLIDASRPRRHPATAFFLFGVCAALTLHTNIIFINFLPLLLMQLAFQVRQWPDDKRPTGGGWWLSAAFGAVAGALVCTVALGLINLAYHRGFWFFGGLLKVSASLIEDPDREKTWWLSWRSLWWASSPHMVFPFAVLIGALLTLTIDAIRGRSATATCVRVTHILCLEYLLAFAIMAFWQTIGHTALQPSYMAYPIQYPMLLGLAALIARWSPVGGEWRFFVVTVLAAAAFVALLGFGIAIPDWMFRLGPKKWTIVQPLTIVLIGVAIAALLHSRPVIARLPATLLDIARYATIGLSLAFANAQLPYLTISEDYAGIYDVREPCRVRRDSYETVVQAHQFVFATFESRLQSGMNPEDVLIWYDPAEPFGEPGCILRAQKIAVPVLATGFGNIVPWPTMQDVDALPDEAFARINDRQTVVAITDNPAKVARLLERLRAHLPAWKVVARRKISTHGMEFTVYALAVGASGE